MTSQDRNTVPCQIESPTATRTASNTAGRWHNRNIIRIVTRSARARQDNEVGSRTCTGSIRNLDRHALSRRAVVRQLDIIGARGGGTGNPVKRSEARS